MEYNESNAKKNRAKEETVRPEKDIKRVVVGEVIIQKKTIGRKFLDIFVETNLKSVWRYVISDVLIPAARNMIVEASSKGVERMMYGESAMRRRTPYGTVSRTTYNNPINRSYTPREMGPPAIAQPLPARPSRYNRTEAILQSKEDAEMVLERMNDILDTYQVVSVGDLNDLIGIESSYVDNKWGWVYLGNVQIRQIREGFVLDLPLAEPIS